VLSQISPTACPVQSLIKSEKIHARTFEWLETALRPSAQTALVEGADASAITISAATSRTNTTQILGEAFQVSASADAVKTYGRAKETALQLSQTLAALKNDVEHCLVGVDQAAVTGSASAARKMASLSQQISTSLDAGGNATDPLTEAKLLTLSQTCFTNGSNPSVLLVKPADASIIAGFATATGRNRDIDRSLVNTIEVLVTPFSELKVVISRACKSTHAFLIDPTMFKQCVLRPFSRTLLAKQGDSDKHFVVGEVSCKHTNFGDSGMITGLS
jgi:hypothetical protein